MLDKMSNAYDRSHAVQFLEFLFHEEYTQAISYYGDHYEDIVSFLIVEI
jgi:hypothetical protein